MKSQISTNFSHHINEPLCVVVVRTSQITGALTHLHILREERRGEEIFGGAAVSLTVVPQARTHGFGG